MIHYIYKYTVMKGLWYNEQGNVILKKTGDSGKYIKILNGNSKFCWGENCRNVVCYQKHVQCSCSFWEMKKISYVLSILSSRQFILGWWVKDVLLMKREQDFENSITNVFLLEPDFFIVKLVWNIFNVNRLRILFNTRNKGRT